MAAKKIFSEEELYELFAHEYPVAPLLTEDEAEMYGLSEAQTQWVTQRAAAQEPIIHQPAVHQQPVPQQQAVLQPLVIQQPVVQQAVVQQPIVQQPIIQQPAFQQPAVQQPAPHRSCPVQSCTSLTGNTRMDHLYDHLAEVHGYERAPNEYSILHHHLKRKTLSTLKGLFIRDIRKLAWDQARLKAVEEAIRQRDNSYVSCHGLGLAMQHSIPQANASKKQGLITLLTNVRNEINQLGSLHNHPGQAQSTWDEVYENLVSTFQLNGNAQKAVVTRASQYFSNTRASMGDDMNVNVTPARVVLTDELVLKPGASLPPK
ncbi:hypothetical protein INS49_007746 [Diaporthe citri]|uniref:uncharacterized protein n=1 Tax=Diaporthe citri TaxID=83186 RepID=UPI001C7F19F5|nr:uncharacterized protein INS49_007746 [Diaporthe citri]KAG6362654.1 hypothetical protein INS49_007746 [Diaporthe citri]